MGLRKVKLVDGYADKGKALGVPVSFIQDANQDKIRVENGWVEVSSREFHRLEEAGLVASVAEPAAGRPPAYDPGPTNPGGAGHLDNDGYSNREHVQREAAMHQLDDALGRAIQGLPAIKLEQAPENLRREGRPVPKPKAKAEPKAPPKPKASAGKA